MKSILSEKTLVVVLFVMVLITFSLAQEDSRKMEKTFSGTNLNSSATSLQFIPQSKSLAEQTVAKQSVQKTVTE